MKKGTIILLFFLFIQILSGCRFFIQPAYTDVEKSTIDYTNITESEKETSVERITQSITTDIFTGVSSIDEKKTENTTEPHSSPTPEPVIEHSIETPTVSNKPVYTYGSAGRLDIPNVGVGVALNNADLYKDNVQSIVDAPDSAAFFSFRDRLMVIADHNNQGFQNIKKVSVGDRAVVSQETGICDIYVCTRVCREGHNLGADLIDEYGAQVEFNTDGELIMYTCNDCWQNVTITFWQKAN